MTCTNWKGRGGGGDIGNSLCFLDEEISSVDIKPGTHVDIKTPRGEISKPNHFSLHLDINLTLTRGY
jgi:hypothetical protein